MKNDEVCTVCKVKIVFRNRHVIEELVLGSANEHRKDFINTAPDEIQNYSSLTKTFYIHPVGSLTFYYSDVMAITFIPYRYDYIYPEGEE